MKRRSLQGRTYTTIPDLETPSEPARGYGRSGRGGSALRVSVLIDGAPEIALFTVDCDDHFVVMPNV